MSTSEGVGHSADTYVKALCESEIGSSMENSKICEKKDELTTVEEVLMGVLAPGVNRSTWQVLKYVMIALGVCLAAMLYAALQSSISALTIHVLVFAMLSVLLFASLSWFLSETGFVSIKQQMKNLNLQYKDEKKAT